MNLTAQVHHSIHDIGRDAWESLNGDWFTSYQLLSMLEDTGCVGEDAGWLPFYVVVRDDTYTIVGATPTWVKAHSMGEFVYDWAWADLYHRVGRSYYPKLITAVPFTPAGGPRLLTSRELDSEQCSHTRGVLARVLRRFASDSGLTASHVLFCREDELPALNESGYFTRTQHQYMWMNHGYGGFDDFLAGFKSKRRREIRRQRRRLDESGVRVRCLHADELADYSDFAWRCYCATIEKFPWSRRYLNRELFVRLFNEASDVVRLFVAFDDDNNALASALCFEHSNVLYGRYWGALTDVSYLHFETCLYAPIEYCIDHGLTRMEPGQGGEHKFSRGYEAVPTFSAHHLEDAQLHEVLRRHTEKEAVAVMSELQDMNDRAAFQPVAMADEDAAAGDG